MDDKVAPTVVMANMAVAAGAVARVVENQAVAT